MFNRKVIELIIEQELYENYIFKELFNFVYVQEMITNFNIIIQCQ